MPKELEEKIRASVKKAHPTYSKERVDREVYSTMNKQASRGAREENRGRGSGAYREGRSRRNLVQYHSRTNKSLDVGREGHARRGIKPSMATRGEREYSANRPGGLKRRYRRDSKGRFA